MMMTMVKENFWQSAEQIALCPFFASFYSSVHFQQVKWITTSVQTKAWDAAADEDVPFLVSPHSSELCAAASTRSSRCLCDPIPLHSWSGPTESSTSHRGTRTIPSSPEREKVQDDDYFGRCVVSSKSLTIDKFPVTIKCVHSGGSLWRFFMSFHNSNNLLNFTQHPTTNFITHWADRRDERLPGFLWDLDYIDFKTIIISNPRLWVR